MTYPKYLINLRKRLLLPIKYWLNDYFAIGKMELRPKKLILIKIKALKIELLKAERLENEEQVKILKGKLELINWITYEQADS